MISKIYEEIISRIVIVVVLSLLFLFIIKINATELLNIINILTAFHIYVIYLIDYLICVNKIMHKHYNFRMSNKYEKKKNINRNAKSQCLQNA